MDLFKQQLMKGSPGIYEGEDNIEDMKVNT